jgi:hypothetical protein
MNCGNTDVVSRPASAPLLARHSLRAEEEQLAEARELADAA